MPAQYKDPTSLQQQPPLVVSCERDDVRGQALATLKDFDLAALPWDDPDAGASDTRVIGPVDPVKRSHTRCVLTFHFQGSDGVPARVYAKRCRVRKWRKRLASLFVPSKCRREWELGWELIRRGLSTAVPLAWAERRAGGMIAESYLLTLGIDDAVSFDQLWRSLPDAQHRVDWLGRLAVFIRQLHDRGFAHDDLSAEHVLVAPGYPAHLAPPQFYVIDLDNSRISRAVRPLRRAHNFFQIFRSLPSRLLGESERTLFLQAYSNGQWSAADIRSVNRAVDLIRMVKRRQWLALLGAGKREVVHAKR